METSKAIKIKNLLFKLRLWILFLLKITSNKRFYDFLVLGSMGKLFLDNRDVNFAN